MLRYRNAWDALCADESLRAACLDDDGLRVKVEPILSREAHELGQDTCLHFLEAENAVLVPAKGPCSRGGAVDAVLSMRCGATAPSLGGHGRASFGCAALCRLQRGVASDSAGLLCAPI